MAKVVSILVSIGVLNDYILRGNSKSITIILRELNFEERSRHRGI
jgi:hypothetical protein